LGSQSIEKPDGTPVEKGRITRNMIQDVNQDIGIQEKALVGWQMNPLAVLSLHLVALSQ
jgi:hypothetical protein